MGEENVIQRLLIPDEKGSIEVFRRIRWADGVYCPKCKSLNIYNRGVKGRTRRYSCNGCGFNFTDFTGTIFAHKKLSLGEMFYILANLDNKSVKRLSEELGRTRQSVHRLAKEFRQDLASSAPDPTLHGKIEIDEMYIHAGDKGNKKNLKQAKGSKKEDEAPIEQINHP